MSSSPSKPPGRGIESIAHHFLSQISPPKRVGPGERSGEAASLPVSEPGILKAAGEIVPAEPVLPKSQSSEPREVEMGQATRMVIVADGSAGSKDAIEGYARQLAYQNGAIGLLQIGREKIELREYVPASVDDGKAGQGSTGAGLRVEQDELAALMGGVGKQSAGASITALPKAYAALSARVEAILVHSEDRELLSPILRVSEAAVVFASSSSEGLVEAYRNIKWLAGQAGFEGEISLFLTDGNEETVSTAQEKLGRTVRQFLNIEMPYAEYPQPSGHVEGRLLAESATELGLQGILPQLLGCQNVEPIASPAKIDDALAARASISEAECDISSAGKTDREISEVLPEANPGETGDTAMYEEFGNKRASAADGENQPVMSSSSPISPQSHEATADIVVYSPLSVSEFPGTEGQLCDVLVKSLPIWLGDIRSPLALPVTPSDGFDPAVRLLIDARGRMYILAPCLSVKQISSRVCGAWHQLTNRIREIAGRYPQLKIDYALYPEAILVAPENLAKPLRGEESNFDFPIHLKRLFFLDDGHNKSLLVI